MSEPSGRVAAFSAAVELAIEEAADDSGSSYRWRSGFDRQGVAERIEQDPSLRTVDRALADAAALGWLTDEVQGWDAGPLAEQFAPDSDDMVTACRDCDAVFWGRTTSCADCGSECIEQVEPADPEHSPI